MQTPITYENLREYAYSNDKLIRGEIKGIVLDFPGCGTLTMRSEELDIHIVQAQKGLINIRPYYNPWCWMNRQTVRFVDEIVSVVMEHYHLPENIPIVSSGTSMGGLGALVYAHEAKRTPIRCVAHCPVCDLTHRFREGGEFPRTIYSAFGSYEDMTLEEAMKTASPIHLVETMPNIPYYLFHSRADEIVNIDAHSRKFVKAMKDYEIQLYEVEDSIHGDLPEELWEQYYKCISDAFM